MKPIGNFICVVILGICAPLLVEAQSVNKTTAAVPRLVKFTGTLTGPSGKAPVGAIGLTFSVYAQPEGGVPLWTETQNVRPGANGQYTVLLGSTRNDGIPAEVFASGERWLGIQPEGEAERPRTLLTSVPYSLKAADAETLGGLPASAYALAGSVSSAGAAPAEAAPRLANPTHADTAPTPQQAGGSGTTNYIAIWTAATTLGNSKLYQATSGNIGLGTTTPTARFEAISASATGIGLLGYESSATGATFGVTGKSASSTGTGVSGQATSASGANYGVVGTTPSPTGIGVSGSNTATTGVAYGVAGTTASTAGVGVLGQATAASGANFGVYGATVSSTGIGVEGNATSGTGVAGVTSGAAGYGVYGVNAATSGNAFGVFGNTSSPAGYAVFGSNLATTGTAVGVGGSTSSTGGIGVSGFSSAASGTTYGVYGSNAATSGQAYGVYGLTTSTSGAGTLGTATATSGTNYGVYGSTASPAGTGVYGIAATGTGVAGGSSAAAGYGVYGANNATSGNAIGVYGNSSSPTGIGVSANATGGGTALLAISTGGGTAGQFTGNVKISGNLTVSGTVSKGGGSFRIDHPLDPEHKYLYHSFVESPDMMNIYNGVATLSKNGDAVVRLPDWFDALNRDFRYQLTCIGGFAPVYIATEVSGNQFKISGGHPGMKVSWQVTGIRKDAFANEHRIPVEEDKEANQ